MPTGPTTTICQVTTTVGDITVARTLARGAVEARAAACAQVGGPTTSVYRWQQAIETAQEWVVVFKTTTDRYPELESYIRANHSYEVPEIVCTPVTAGNPAYLAWVAAETT
jgi:periplasmic divalent cation tolerance protein